MDRHKHREDRDRDRHRNKDGSRDKERDRERGRDRQVSHKEKNKDKSRSRSGSRDRGDPERVRDKRDRSLDWSTDRGKDNSGSRNHQLSSEDRWRRNYEDGRRDGETFIEYRKRMRETLSGSPVWASSPSPPPSPRKKSSSNRRTHSPSKSLSHDVKSIQLTSRSEKLTEKEKERSYKKNDKKIRKKKESERKKSQKKKKHSKNSSSSGSGSSGASSGSSSDGSSSSGSEDRKRKKRKEEIEDLIVDPDVVSMTFWAEKKVADNLTDVQVGPRPLVVQQAAKFSYGGAMLPGEAEAIAQYVQQNKRIPRRGEVGLTSDEISHFEDVGFVMSGSRHKRMNAVRIRKENQVYSAEEKHALAMFNHEEKAKRENRILAEFRDMISTSMMPNSK